MTPEQFKTWMDAKKLKVRDVSFFTKLNTNTIYSFLRGESVHDSTVEKLEGFRRDYDAKRVPVSA